jgi:hypothetical protein
MKNGTHLTEDQIATFAEALSSGTESSLPEEWRKHVAECDQCAQEVKIVSQIIDDETKEFANKYQKKNKPFPSRTFLVRFAVAASIVVLIGLAVFFTIDYTSNKDEHLTNLDKPQPVADTSEKKNYTKEKPESRKKDTNKHSAGAQETENIEPYPKHQASETNKDRLAYAPNNQLEQLSERFKDANMRGSDVFVLSPHEIEYKQGSQILIKIENPENSPLILEFFNNKGEKLFEKETSEETCLVEKLTTPGLYYWKLLNQDFDLLYCGKIVIEE